MKIIYLIFLKVRKRYPQNGRVNFFRYLHNGRANCIRFSHEGL